jgi:glycosyltransferase involved in cell wall biosynthesis
MGMVAVQSRVSKLPWQDDAVVQLTQDFAMPAEGDLYAGCRRAILVLGMHRSGTSALTRVLSLRGAALPKRIMRPTPDNQAGFWEPSEIAAIHDEILASAGSSWHDVSEFPHSWFASDIAASFKQRLVAALREDFSDAPLFIVKDPRICRLVPLWLSIFEQMRVAPLFVISIRNPLEVTASLRERDAFSEAKSLLLWLRHFLAAERSTRGLRRSFVDYERLVRDWRGVVDRIGCNLDVIWPRQSHAADIEIENFVSTRLRHHVFGSEEVHVRRNLAPWLKTVFDWATRAASGRPTTPDELDSVHAALEAADLAFMPLVAANEASLAAQAAELEHLRAEVASLNERGEVLQARTADLTAKITAQDATIAALYETLAERNRELGVLRGTVSARDANIAVLDQALGERDRNLGGLRDTLSARDANIAVLQSAILALRASTSWRITAPLRFVRRLLGRFQYGAVGYPLTLCWRVLSARSRAPLRDWGATRCIARSALFNREWYVVTNPDVAACGIDPVRHYVAFGAQEGRDPSPSFSTRCYLSLNPDVAAAGLNPLFHFIRHGAAEGRVGGSVAGSVTDPATQVGLPSATAEVPANGHRTLFFEHKRGEDGRSAKQHSRREALEADSRLATFGSLQSTVGRKLVIVGADMPPMFDKHSGGLRLYNLVRMLCEMDWRVVFASLCTLEHFTGMAGSAEYRKRYEGLLYDLGVEQIVYGAEQGEILIRALGNELHWAFLSFPGVAEQFIPPLRIHAPWANVIYDMVDFHALRMSREAELKSDKTLQANAERMRVIELTNAKIADVTVVTSEAERQVLLEIDPTLVVEVISNVFDLTNDPRLGVDDRSGLLFVGGFWHSPNEDAVLWFVRDVWPLILKQRPDMIFRVAGSNPSEQILALRCQPGIEVLGYVPSLTYLFDRSRMSVAPLRYGAGVKGKVGQSMAYGLPVVATAIAAEGMSLEHGKHLLVADAPDEFAAAVLRLATDDDLWRRLQANGRRFVEDFQSMDAVRGQLRALMDG